MSPMDDAVLMGVFQRIGHIGDHPRTVSKYWPPPPPRRSEEDVTDAPSGDGLELYHIGAGGGEPRAARGLRGLIGARSR